MELLKQALVAIEDARVRMQSAYAEAPDELLAEALAELAVVHEKTLEALELWAQRDRLAQQRR